jgi:hypothetical protein
MVAGLGNKTQEDEDVAMALQWSMEDVVPPLFCDANNK